MADKRYDGKAVLKNLDLIIAGTASVFLVCVTFLGVIMRYCFNKPFIWEEEVQLACFVWIVFFGAGAAFRTGNHVSIDFIVDRMPMAVQKVVNWLIYIGVMAIELYLLIQSCELIVNMARMQRRTDILHIPLTYIYIAAPIGCILMMLNYSYTYFKNRKGGGKDATD